MPVLWQWLVETELQQWVQVRLWSFGAAVLDNGFWVWCQNEFWDGRFIRSTPKAVRRAVCPVSRNSHRVFSFCWNSQRYGLSLPDGRLAILARSENSTSNRVQICTNNTNNDQEPFCALRPIGKAFFRSLRVCLWHSGMAVLRDERFSIPGAHSNLERTTTGKKNQLLPPFMLQK